MISRPARNRWAVFLGLTVGGTACAQIVGLGDAPLLPAEDGGGEAAATDGAALDDARVDGSVLEDAMLDADAPLDADAEADVGADGEPVDDGSAPLTLTGFALGQRATCAIRPDGGVACWGSNDDGQLASGDEDAATFAVVPRAVASLANVIGLVAGEQHFCAIVGGGGVWCWGYVGNGATGTGNTSDDLVPTAVPGVPAIERLVAEQNGVCAIASDGRSLWCWGNVNLSTPASPGGAPQLLSVVDAGVIQMAAGQGGTCALFEGGAVRCWGENFRGQLGLGLGDAGAIIDVPTLVPGLGVVVQIAAGGAHVCAVTDAHTLECWGENSSQQLGPGGGAPTEMVSSPIDTGMSHVVQVGCGDEHTCALFDDAGVSCWGANASGELGSSSGGGPNPAPVPNLGAATAIAVGPFHACAKQTDGGVACWGNNDWHQLGGGAQIPARPTGAVPVAF